MRWTVGLILIALVACGRGESERYAFLEGEGIAYEDMPAIRAALPFEKIQLVSYSPWLFGQSFTTLWLDGRAEQTAAWNRPEARQGEVSLLDFGSLCHAIETLDFESMERTYDWGGFDGLELTLRVWRTGETEPLEVTDIGNVGPIEFWLLQTAIDGVASRVEWEPVPAVVDDAASDR